MKEPITKRDFYEIVYKYEMVLVDLLKGKTVQVIKAKWLDCVKHCHRKPHSNMGSCSRCLFYPDCMDCYCYRRDGNSSASAVHPIIGNEIRMSRDLRIAHCLRFLDRLVEIEREKGWET